MHAPQHMASVTVIIIRLTPRQSTLIHGWINPVPTLTWDDVRRRRKLLTFDYLLLTAKLRPADLVTLQADPVQWIKHTGACLKHVRQMIIWPANPFKHFDADLADVLSMKFTCIELILMGVTYNQLVMNGMNEQTERMFHFDEDEWSMIGRNSDMRCTHTQHRY